ncbi:MAG: sulfite exporter TauE/SafE family protein [Dysgonamonadaceae bacterium]
MVDTGLLILGLAAGILSGLFGIGGGIVMVPSLIAFFGFSILDANSISLTAMLLPVGIFGVAAYYRAGYISIRNASWIAVGLLAGSYFGAELAEVIKEGILARLYALFLFYIALTYLDIPKFFKGNTPKPLSDPQKSLNPAGMIAVGVLAGVIAGLFGKGGGIIIVPALVNIFHYDTKAAVATSLAALQLPVGLPSVLVYAHNGHLNLHYAALIAVGIVIGAYLGSRMAVKIPSGIFKKTYALFLFAVAFYMAFRYI